MKLEPQRNALVVICGGHAEVESAIRSLYLHGFDMKGVSVIGPDVPGDRDVVGCYQAGGRSKYRGPLGAFWESLWELLDGSGFFWMPDFGWILVAGPVTRWVVASLDNSAIFSGLTAVGSAMYGVGIPLDDIVRYEASLKAGRLLLIVHGSATGVDNARQFLYQEQRARDLHAPPANTS